MLTHDDMDQLRGLIREEIAAEGKAIRREITVTNTGTKADLARVVDRLTSLEIAVAGVDQKLDRAQEDIAAILTTVIDYHTALSERVTQIEERLHA